MELARRLLLHYAAVLAGLSVPVAASWAVGAESAISWAFPLFVAAAIAVTYAEVRRHRTALPT